MTTDLEMLTALGLAPFLYPSDLVDQVIDRRNNPVRGITAPWSKLDGLFELPMQGVTLMGGYSGHSKSTLANQWALHAAATGHKVCIASLELTTDYLFDFLAGQSACRMEPHEGYLQQFGRWLDERMYIVDHNDVLSPDEAINLIIDSKRLLGCDLFVLDCLMQIDLGGELEAEKQFMARLAATARAYEIAIVVVHHCRKPQGLEGERKVPGREAFIGSSHLVNASAACLILWCDKQKAAAKHNGEEVDDDNPDFILSVAKNRFAPFEGMIGLYQHEKARLLCNNRQRQYKPIHIPKEDACQFDEKPTGESPSESTTSILPTRNSQESTSEIAPEMMMSFGASRS